ncbi:MAG TPA: substrate-binding domain-containing protein [Candidatus Limnocylindrales bacterium]|nr:substrate-binding domain-containing protein [Candidatus Limnocylindrales bacterium]
MLFRKYNLPISLLALVLTLTLAFFAAGCAPEAAPVTKPEEEPAGEVEILGYITLSTTTSTYDSGLLDFINPIFTAQSGIEVRIVSLGTGAALESGQRGDADVLLVHDRATELKLVEEGYFVDRFDVMYNDFVIVGPADDPAGVLAAANADEAFNLIALGKHPFASRGDDSGTNRKELRLWAAAGIDPKDADWYFSIGQGMGDTLRFTNEKLGYTVVDRGTFIALRNGLALTIVLEGDPVLFNQYGVMVVNPELHPHVKYDLAMEYVEFLMSDEGQNLITSYQIDGETLFFPGFGLE